ncbi:solute carrier family 23 protein [Tuberibacillus sp. Marseille-P3662]|uniref:solute carrier family 23 protein n=1 Tax=Tuberibacillus sp. Marseille-P3662 TaxID=1965358 RepID=UPI000A1C7C62|nr:solute carrier family 23 protein [Tuberibacillus sp. Marseille-P3662]
MEDRQIEDHRTSKSESHVTIGLEEQFPPVKGLLYGLQHVFVSNVWLDPVFVAAMIGLPFALSANMINAIFIAAGLVTLVQATRWVRLPVVQGPSAAFDALMISSGKTHTLPAAGGGVIVSAAIVFLLAVTGILAKMKAFFTPVISGTVIFIVGIGLSEFTLNLFLGGAPGTKNFLNGDVLAMSITTALLVIILSVFGTGMWRSFSFLIALVIGDIIGFVLGALSFSDIATRGWFGWPHFMPYGALHFDLLTFMTFFIAYIVAVIEAMGVYQAAADMVGVKLDQQRLRSGFAGESAGSMLSTLFGGFPTTGYGQNVGLMRLTGVGSRHAVKVAGIIFLILGFVPKAGAVLAITPDAVVGGMFLPAAASLIFTGINILNRMAKTEANFVIAGLSILLAIALPDDFSSVDNWAGRLLGNTILVGALTAMLLQLVLVNIPNGLKSLRKEGHV